MNSRMFRSFVKTAMELQADQDTPGDYVVARAAVEAKFGKIASAGETVGRALDAMEKHHKAIAGFGIGAGAVSLAQYLKERKEYPEGKNQFRWATGKEIAPRIAGGLAGAGIGHLLTKKAGLDALELAGLGTLAAPAVSGLAGHHMKEKHKDIAEVAGLGMLAAPYAHNIAARRSAGYAGSRVGKAFSKAFSH